MLNGLLPLDLVVIFMLSKFLYTYFVEVDIQMYDEERSINSGALKYCDVKNLELL